MAESGHLRDLASASCPTPRPPADRALVHAPDFVYPPGLIHLAQIRAHLQRTQPVGHTAPRPQRGLRACPCRPRLSASKGPAQRGERGRGLGEVPEVYAADLAVGVEPVAWTRNRLEVDEKSVGGG